MDDGNAHVAVTLQLADGYEQQLILPRTTALATLKDFTASVSGIPQSEQEFWHGDRILKSARPLVALAGPSNSVTLRVIDRRTSVQLESTSSSSWEQSQITGHAPPLSTCSKVKAPTQKTIAANPTSQRQSIPATEYLPAFLPPMRSRQSMHMTASTTSTGGRRHPDPPGSGPVSATEQVRGNLL